MHSRNLYCFYRAVLLSNKYHVEVTMRTRDNGCKTVVYFLSVQIENDSVNPDLWLQGPSFWIWILWNHILSSCLQLIHHNSPSHFCVAILSSWKSEEMEKIKNQDKHLSNKRHRIILIISSFLLSHVHLSTSFSCAHVADHTQPEHAHRCHTVTF